MTDSPTPSQTIGPFFSHALTPLPANRLAPIIGNKIAQSCNSINLCGQIKDGNGDVVQDALVEIYHRPLRHDSVEAGANVARSNTNSGTYQFEIPLPEVDERVEVIVFMRGLLHHLHTFVVFEHQTTGLATQQLFANVAEHLHERLTAQITEPKHYRFDIHLQGEYETPFFSR